MIIYHVRWEYRSHSDDLGLFTTLEGGRAAVLRQVRDEEWEEPSRRPERVEDLEPWFEDGVSKASPTYSCEYHVNGGVYSVSAREVNE